MQEPSLRLCWLDTADERDVAHVLSEQAIRYPAPKSEYPGAVCMCSAVLRRATVEEVEQWKAS